MLKPNENVQRSILNLENNISWKEIVGWIEKSLIAQSVDNNSRSGENAIKGQGRGLELEDLLKYIRKARDYQSNKEA